MEQKIDALETRLRNIYKYSDPRHIHERPNKRLQKQINQEAQEKKWEKFQYYSSDGES